ncbi:MAG TPA: hypothetical protein VN066_02260 [Rhodocyclaceae bacterium]|nr:hypothetical protein [Rhodocyclaceae bacterium]
MKKTSILHVTISTFLLAAVGYGATLHARDSVPATVQNSAIHARSSATDDVDLVGVIGDTLVDGCKASDGGCAKAWKDLGELAGKKAL